MFFWRWNWEPTTEYAFQCSYLDYLVKIEVITYHQVCIQCSCSKYFVKIKLITHHKVCILMFLFEVFCIDSPPSMQGDKSENSPPSMQVWGSQCDRRRCSRHRTAESHRGFGYNVSMIFIVYTCKWINFLAKTPDLWRHLMPPPRAIAHNLSQISTAVML